MNRLRYIRYLIPKTAFMIREDRPLLAFLFMLVLWLPSGAQKIVTDSLVREWVPTYSGKQALNSSEVYKIDLKADEADMADMFPLLEDARLEIGPKVSVNLMERLSHLPYLQRLSLNVKDASFFPEGIGQLKNLRTLHIESRKMSSIPDEVARLENLELLALEGMSITRLPGWIAGMKSLKAVFLYELPNLDYEQAFGILSKVEGLETVHIHNAGLKNIPSSITGLKSLQRLCFESNPSLDLAGGIPLLRQLPALSMLQLKHNKLKTVPGSIKDLERLRTLDLGDNELEALPLAITEMKGIEHLHVSGNRLQGLPAGISGMQGLKILSANKNEISDLPESLFSLTLLEQVYLDHNKLAKLPSSLSTAPALKELSIEYNPKLDLPVLLKQLASVASLEGLWLAGSSAPAFPIGLGDLRQLRSLGLAFRLQSFPEEILKLGQIEKLFLQGNKLQQLPGGISSLSSLRWLDLSDNPVELLPYDMLKLKNLEVLDLSGTRLKLQEGFDLSMLPGLRAVFVENSPLSSIVSPSAGWKLFVNDYGIIFSSDARLSVWDGVDNAAGGRYQEALASYNMAIELDTYFAQAYYKRGSLKLFDLKDAAGAQADFDRALELDSLYSLNDVVSRPDLYRVRGYAREAQGNKNGAAADYKQAIKLDHRNDNAWSRLAYLDYDGGRYESSIEGYSKAISLSDKPNHAYYYMRGLARQMHGQKQEACADWKKATELGCKYSPAMLDKHCR
jgi:Leucine-rich repeat (LRR) protein